MKVLSEEQVLNLRLNLSSNIWTTGLVQLEIGETYQTPYGVIACKPGHGWVILHYKTTGPSEYYTTYIHYPLQQLLQDLNVNFHYVCPIISKLHKKRTSGLIFKLFGYPHDSKCWFK